MSHSKPKTLEETREHLKKVLKSSCLFGGWTDGVELTRDQYFDWFAKKCTRPYSDLCKSREELTTFMWEFSVLYCRETESDKNDYRVWSEAEMKDIRSQIRRFKGSSVSDLLTQVLFPLQKDDKDYSYMPGKSLDKVTKCFWKKVDEIIERIARGEGSSGPDEEPIQTHKSVAGASRAVPAASNKEVAGEVLELYVRHCLQSDDCKTPPILHGSTQEFLMDLVDNDGFNNLSPEQIRTLATAWTAKVFEVIVPSNVSAPLATQEEVAALKDVLTLVRPTSYDNLAQVFPLQKTNFVRFTTLQAMGLAACVERIFRQIVDRMCKDKAEKPDPRDGTAPVASDSLPYSFPLSDAKARKAFVQHWVDEFGRCWEHADVVSVFEKIYQMFKKNFSELSSDSEHQANHGLVKQILEAYVSNSADLVRAEGGERASLVTVDTYRENLVTKFREWGPKQINNMVYPEKPQRPAKKVQYIGSVMQYSFVDSLLSGLELHIKFVLECEEKLRLKDANRAVGEKTRRLAGPVSVNKFPVGTKKPGVNTHIRFADSDLEDEERAQDGESSAEKDAAAPEPKKPKHTEPAKKGGPKRAGPAQEIAPAVGPDEAAAAPKPPSFGFTLSDIPDNLDLTTLTIEEIVEIGKARIRAVVVQRKPDAADPFPDSTDSQAIVEAALARPRLHTPSTSDDE